MKRFGLLMILPFFLIFSCETAPTHSEMEFLLDILDVDDVITVALPPEISVPSEEQPVEELPSEERIITSPAFDPDNISEELYETTKAEIQDIIQRLDNIIRAGNYNEWREFIAESYLEEISSPEFLEERTEELFRRDQLVAAAMGRNPVTVEKKVLRTLRDYFDNVVVPSRASDRVDDISFTSETKVRAYTVNNRGARLILYDLEIIGDSWKIIG